MPRRTDGSRAMTWSSGLAEEPASAAAPRLARAVLTTVLVAFSLVALARLVLVGNPALIPAAVVLLAAMLTLQIGYFGRTQPYGRWRYVALAAEAVLGTLPLVFLGQEWIGVPGFLAGSALLTLPPYAGVAAVGLIVVLCMTAQFLFTGSPLDVFYTGVSTVITSLVVFGLTRLAQLVVELQRTRADLARLEVTRERLRIAQDLHDLLGSSLTAITLRIELARARLRTPAGVTQVAAELEAVTRLSRQTLGDVRRVSAGPLRASLDDEVEQAVSLLRTAGIDVRADLDDRAAADLAAPPRTALATALREGVTNVLRHGGRRSCAIRLHRDARGVVLEIRNDLPDGPDPAAPESGQGLANLADRLAAVDGRLDAGADGSDAWQLVVTVPVENATAPALGGAS